MHDHNAVYGLGPNNYGRDKNPWEEDPHPEHTKEKLDLVVELAKADDHIAALEADLAAARRESAKAFAEYIQQHDGMVESRVYVDGQEGTSLQSAFIALEEFRAAVRGEEEAQ